MRLSLFSHGSLHPVCLPPGERLVDRLGHDLEQSAVDFSLAVTREPSIRTRNPVKEEEDVEEGGGNQVQGRKDPDDQCKAHASEDGSLAEVLLRESLDLVKEFRNRALDGVGGDSKPCHVDRSESQGIDYLSRAGAE